MNSKAGHLFREKPGGGFSHDTNQSRVVGLPLKSSDPDTMQELPWVTGMASNPAKLERCVKKVRAKGGVDNPYAVCVASTGLKPHG